MDDWSLLPSRNAESEPAPNPPSTMTTTTLPARLTRPRQAPPAGVTHPRPQPAALDPTALAWQPRNQSGAKPHNPSDRAPHRDPASRTPIRNSPFHTRALDNPRPFMDDREGRSGSTSWRKCARRYPANACGYTPRAPAISRERGLGCSSGLSGRPCCRPWTGVLRYPAGPLLPSRGTVASSLAGVMARTRDRCGGLSAPVSPVGAGFQPGSGSSCQRPAGCSSIQRCASA
jgi:hypothetical protein